MAFMLGIGVAAGDILVTTLRRVRRHVVEPAVGAVAGGVHVFVVAPIERAAAPIAARWGGDASEASGPGEVQDPPDPPSEPNSA